MTEKPTQKHISGYAIWQEEHREEYKGKGQMVEIAKLMGDDWKLVSEEDKKIYNERYKEEKLAYDQALLAYYEENPEKKEEDEREALNKKYKLLCKSYGSGFAAFFVVHTCSVLERIPDMTRYLKFMKQEFDTLNPEQKQPYAKKFTDSKKSEQEAILQKFSDYMRREK